ncbi:MAG TPA: phosphotransferase, partial [Acidimicrobiales bacterium]|nr:phosphotransferase [Acidimicrobiales bacterium]
MPDIDRRDPDEVAATLTRWLATRSPGGTGPEVFDVQAPASNGFSNETILCRTRAADGVEGRLVVRVAPSKHLLFMDAEFSTQYRVMKALADGGSVVPLPPLGDYEEDTQYLGVPFFTMQYVEGKVPSDNIPYTMEGWVIEATPEEQARMWWSGLDALAAVHRTDWRALGLDWLGMAG